MKLLRKEKSEKVKLEKKFSAVKLVEVWALFSSIGVHSCPPPGQELHLFFVKTAF